VDWPPYLRDRVLQFMVRAALGAGREIAELNRALAEIEETLAQAPTTAGESRVGILRAVIVGPVSVFYRVDQAS
jgi:hypothetical protein